MKILWVLIFIFGFTEAQVIPMYKPIGNNTAPVQNQATGPVTGRPSLIHMFSLPAKVSVPKTIFTVVASNIIRKGKPYTIKIVKFGFDAPIQLEVKIIGLNEKGVKFPLLKKNVTIQTGKWETSIVYNSFCFTEGEYTLTVQNAFGYSDQRPLTYMSKEFSLLIQLNKAIFLPGDLLRFRIFSVDSETLAVNPAQFMSIYIVDPNKNVVTTFANVTFESGRYKNSLRIASSPLLGIWSVIVQNGAQTISKDFEVATYELPLVSSSVSMPTRVPFANGKVPVIVSAQYTFGGTVNGIAIIKIERDMNVFATRNVTLSSGSVSLDLDVKKDLLAIASRTITFGIHVTIYDEMLGSKTENNAKLTILPFTRSIVINGDPYLKPSEPFNYTVTVKMFDGTPAEEGLEVVITIRDADIKEKLILGEGGSVSSSFIVPEDISSVSIKASTKEASVATLDVDVPFHSEEEVSMRIDVVTKNPKIDDEIRLKATLTENRNMIFVHIISKGILLESRNVSMSDDLENDDNPKTVTFAFKSSFLHAPVTSIIAYYVKLEGAVISATTNVLLANKLPNYVKFSFDQKKIQPGSEFKFSIESLVNTSISLLAIDQRVLLLKGGHSILRQNVFDELDKFNIGSDSSNFIPFLITAESAFQTVGLIMMSNLPLSPTLRQPFPKPLPTYDIANIDGIYNNDDSDIKIRSNLADTFLWEEIAIRSIEVQNNGTATITAHVPDSITTYVISGVAMSSTCGLGISSVDPKVTTFLPFFIQIKLPFSVKRGEKLNQEIVIFNSIKEQTQIVLTIEHDSRLVIIDAEANGWKIANGSYSKTLIAQPSGNFKETIPFNPIEIGLIPIKITAKGSLSGDRVEKALRVVPEGIARSVTNSTMIVLEPSVSRQKRDVLLPTFNGNSSILTIKLPPGAYLDTVKASAIVVGDILGKAMNNLENLIDFPSGCGEQNLIKLVPNIAVWKYLESSCDLSEAQKKKLYHFSLAGYQNQLNFQRKDGSFSAFGSTDVNGSTWLTSYTILSLYWAKDFIPIDLKVISKGLNFINSTQNCDGSFKENGKIIHADMQGSLGASIALTAYISITLSNVLPSYCNFSTTRDKANQYLVDNLHLATNVFEKGLVAYALQLAGIQSAFNSFYFDRIETPTMIYWKNKEPEVNSFWTKSAPRSVDVEITAYGLLLMLQTQNIQDAAKIAKYLVSKSNSFGGYGSTQDTVMALVALSKFSARVGVNNPKIDLVLSTSTDPGQINVKIDSSNVATTQQFELPSSARDLKFKAEPGSRGIAIITFGVSFYEDPEKVVPAFEISYNFTDFCSAKILFNSCARYIPDGGVSNMAIMAVTLPSGFFYQNNALKDLNPEVTKVEVFEQGSKVTFYFNSISNKASCVSIQAYRTRFVSDVKGGTIVVHDYYDTSREGSAKYELPDLSGKCAFREYGFRISK